MIQPSAFRPYTWTPELVTAASRLRPFLYSNPGLPGIVQAEQLARFVGREPDPVSRVAEALNQRANSDELCQLLTSDVGQIALSALALEFPGWGLVFQVLPFAAKALCDARRPDSNNKAFAVGALLVGAGLILYGLSGRKAA